MGLLPLPKVSRCCFCTRNLRVACVFIAIWSMLVTSHGLRIMFMPTCTDMYDDGAGPMQIPLIVFKWILVLVNSALILSSFAFLLGLLMSIPVTAGVFIGCGLTSAILSIFFAIFYFIQQFSAKCSFNPSDVVALIMYALWWCYFIIIVNSHQDEMKQ